MRKEDLKNWTRDQMKDEILRLEKENKELDRQNTDVQNRHIKLYNDTKEEIRRLKEKNEELREDIQKLKDNQEDSRSCEGSKNILRIAEGMRKMAELSLDSEEMAKRLNKYMNFSKIDEDCENCSCEDDLPFSGEETDIDDLLCELQDQHQQDCIRINDLTTTINVLTGLYANLRKNVGMD